MEVFPALSACSLFAGLTQDEIAAILPCLSARQAGFRRGQFLLRAGDEVRFAGVVLAGEAEIGAEALELAEQIRPDVVLTDIKMPFMDGRELCRRLRRELFFARLLDGRIPPDQLSERAARYELELPAGPWAAAMVRMDLPAAGESAERDELLLLSVQQVLVNQL